jgi:protein-tyrosine kinase
VLLVDADVLRPDLLPRLGLELRPGLLDLLGEPELTLREVVLQTDIPKLSVLPAGNRREDAAELLGSPAMSRLLTEMLAGASNRIVIFDAPPLLLATEAVALARQMGQVVVVVEADSTPRKAVLQAFAVLEDCRHVQALLNKAPTAPSYGYGDYYG